MTNTLLFFRNIHRFIPLRKGIPIMLIVIFYSFPTFAQQTIQGKVVDRDNQPIPGVTVFIESASSGTITDINGTFSIASEQPLPVVLTITFLGFRTEEVYVYEAKDPVNITLSEDINMLNEIVVTGVAVGTSRKSLSFALTKVDDELLNTVPATDASTSLRGKVAGLRVDQSGGNRGASVYLRGSKSVGGDIEPLIVVDGFVTGLRLSDISPNDIESMEIVKGAAASALYGTRGEGGIIQILTKKGRNDRKIEIVVDNEVGFTDITMLPPTSQYHHYKVTPDGSFQLVDGARVIDYKENGFSVNLHPYKDFTDNTENILGSNNYFNNSISISANGDKHTIYLSAQNQYKGGVSNFMDADTRQNLLFNLGYKVSEKLTADLTAQYSFSSNPSEEVSTRSGGLLYATLLVEPHINLAEKDADGKYTFFPSGSDLSGQQWSNPLYNLTNKEFGYHTENLLLGGKLRYHITKHLSAETSASLQTSNYNTEAYYPIGFRTITPNLELNDGNYALSNQQSRSKNGQLQLNYNRTFGDFDWGLAAKYVYESSKLTGFSASGRKLTAPVKNLNATESSTRSISSTWEKTVNVGYFINLKIAWKDKLFVDALGRLDQSSRFGREVGTAFFPRVAAAYRVTEDIKVEPLTELKLRVAYGQAGSLPPFGAKDSRVSISSTGGVSYTQNDNTDLKRAVTEETELGLDAVIDNWLNVQFNYAFSNSTNDFISVPAFAPISGSANIYANLGAVKSSSLELEINGRVFDKKHFTWIPGVTFSRVRSKITSLGDVPEFTQNGFRKAVGASTTAIYGYSIFSDLSQLETNESGFVTNAGDGTNKIEDYVVNEFGVVVEKAKLGTANEEPVFYVNSKTGNSKIIGEASPDFNVGLTNALTYGPFSLYAVLDWQQGGEKFNETAQYLTYVYRSEFSDLSAMAGKPLNFTTRVFNASQVTDYWIENTTYVALRELSLTYKIPTNKIGLNKWLQKASFSLIGRNLFIWTDYKGVNIDGIGRDEFNYPSYRVISGRLTLNF